MIDVDPQAYGPVFAPLLATDRQRPLDAGTPNEAARAALDALSPEAAFAHTKIGDRDMAACCVSGVWLLHDFLDESHTISQGIETASGSFWHAIMHRREGDFSNSKYWFRRVGPHPVLDALGQRAGEICAARGEEQVAKQLLSGGAWDAFAFVDLCQSAVRQGDATELCRDIQQAEWELLFDHCYQMAVNA
jgi:hypothetical protein